jgi:hypothetical protein
MLQSFMATFFKTTKLTTIFYPMELTTLIYFDEI